MCSSDLWYCESTDQIANNLVEVSPTLMTAVPRLYEVLHDRIMRGVRAKGGMSEKLFMAAVRLGTKRYQGRRLLPHELVLNMIVDRLVRTKVRSRLGGRLQYFISGGAALNPEIGNFFMALGINILQGYGQTEASPLISANRPKRIKIESVGPPVAGIDVRIADDGELLVRGDLLMKGYWRDDAATAATIRDGWLYTGDIAAIDDEGYISITGRKKDIIVNSGGDNIAPQRIEGFLTLQPEIGQAMVHGDKRPHLVALIVPDADFAGEWARANGAEASLPALCGNDAFRAAVGEAIERINADLSVIERVRRFILAREPFSVANELMTPTLKVKRHKVREIYGQKLDALYREQAR